MKTLFAIAAPWIAAVALILGGSSIGQACPFCSAPSLTMSEQVDKADVLVLVKWLEARKARDNDSGSTTYAIEEVVKGAKSGLKKGDKVQLSRYRSGKKDELFLILGTKGATIDWGSPLEVTRESFEYVAKAPSPMVPTAKRLEYFVKYLEFPNEFVSTDAYGEFANAPYSDITKLEKHLPRDRLRKWLENPETSPARIGLYGLLLGLCGTEVDAKMMEKRILQPTEDFRLGIDGVMAGYLLLKGSEGLKTLDESKLKNKKVPFSETYAAMQALRFMWTYAEGKIPPDRLRASMRLLLDRSELADLVIADLARWKDWGVQDRLMELYDAPDYNIPSIKRSIVRYFMVAAKDIPAPPAGNGGAAGSKKNDEVKLPRHVVKARIHMATLRMKDPKTVQEAERFFLLN